METANWQNNTGRTTFGQSSSPAKGPQIWNTLPSEIKTLTNFKTFNTEVTLWLKQSKPVNTEMHTYFLSLLLDLPFSVIVLNYCFQSLLFQSLFVVVYVFVCFIICLYTCIIVFYYVFSLKSLTRDKDCKFATARSPIYNANVTMSIFIVPVK